MKDIGTGFYTLCPPPVNNVRDFSHKNYHSPILVLGKFRAQSYDIPVNITPILGW